MATSKPKKYFKAPKFFIPNLVSRSFFKSTTHCESFPMINMSSTYTKRAMKQEPFECTKRAYSDLDYTNPNSVIVVGNLACHCLLACFKP